MGQDRDPYAGILNPGLEILIVIDLYHSVFVCVERPQKIRSDLKTLAARGLEEPRVNL